MEVYVLKVRIKFRKTGVVKFVGHLDLLRYFQKSMRRADIDIAYSEGFSPHQIMSFASPLGVGITSDGEYMDIEIRSFITTKEAMKRLNETMVEGIEVLSFKQLADNNKNAMSIVAAADYEVTFRENCAPVGNWEEKVAAFFGQEEIIVTKTTKKSTKDVDIKPLIHSITAKNGTVSMQVASGSFENLKPELVMQAFCEFIDFEPKEFALMIHRKELYANIGDEENIQLIALEEMGEDINE
jgi:radical SAM-linked protein